MGTAIQQVEQSLLQKAVMAYGPEALFSSLSTTQRRVLLYSWKALARPSQLPPLGDWLFWMLKAGRGFGKTRTGAEWVRDRVEKRIARRIAFMGATHTDAIDTMVNGESGIIAVSPPWNKPEFRTVQSVPMVLWPNGARARIFTAEKPERLRGPAHDTGWADELASWKYPEITWDNFLYGFRSGPDPRCCITTTPKPIKLIKALVKDPDCRITEGSSYENILNLSPIYTKRILPKYEGTRLGRQEIHGEVLDDNPNALFSRKLFDEQRVVNAPKDLVQVVVAIDPAVTSGEDSDDTGIVVAGKDFNDHYYILGDFTLKDSPSGWASAAIKYYCMFTAGLIIGEANNGGDLIETVIRTIGKDPAKGINIGGGDVFYKKVHASRGKATRAEPVSALQEQGRLHCVGTLGALEDECCEWEPGMDSPNRMDAMVWAITALMDVASQWMREL